MPLILTVLRCPESIPPETRTIAGGEFTVGRGPGVDWILPDPERLLSKRHFTVAYRGGAWQIADTSTNGTTLNRDADPIGHGVVRTLRDGDRLSLGAYEIEVRLNEGVSHAGFDGVSGAGRAGAAPFADSFALDPLAPPAPPRRPFDERADPFALAPGGPHLPPDFDLLASDPNPAPFLGPTQQDHRPVLEDAFQPPSIGFSPAPPGKLPDDVLLPDDWDKDLLSGIHPPSAAPAADAARSMPLPAAGWQPASQPAVSPAPIRPAPVQRESPPVARPAVGTPVEPVAPAGADPFAPSSTDPFAEQEPPRGVRGGDQASSRAAPTPFDEPFDLDPPPEPPASPSPAGLRPAASPASPSPAGSRSAAPPASASPAGSRPAASPASPPEAGDAALLAAFLQGAGMEDVTIADPVLAMRRLGAAFRTLVTGVRAVLIARASIKSEFRIEQTMIRARGNNPLKFSADDDDALIALLGTGRRSDMTAAEAVADALKDIRRHELASMNAMQSAVRTLLDGLDPARLRSQAEQGGLSVLPAQRKARAWDVYEALHTRTVRALADDFDSVFGKAFARAYERAMEDIAAEDQ